MKKILVLGTFLALALGFAADVETRERRPRRPVDHYTFDPEHLDKKIAPYRGRFDRVIILNEFSTVVSEADGLCKLEWSGRRVDYLLESSSATAEFTLDMPRGAGIDDVTLYLVGGDGKSARELDDPPLLMRGDTLVVLAPDLEDAVVLDLDYRFVGNGVTVDEAFVFQPEWPLLDATYSFSVSRDLWQEAADQGLEWEFVSMAYPRPWDPERRDTPEHFRWLWHETGMEPVAEDATIQTARRVEVKGYLPAPALAGIDPDDLPRIDALRELSDLEARLRQGDRMMREEGGVSGPGTTTSGRGSGGQLPERSGKR